MEAAKEEIKNLKAKIIEFELEAIKLKNSTNIAHDPSSVT